MQVTRFTAVCDAGAEVICHHSPRAYYELEQEGKLKMRTYAYMYVTDNSDPKAEIARIAAQRAELSGEYFHIIGAKAFLDGVTEAHTGWQNRPIPSSRSTMREPTSSSIPTIPSLR